MELLPARYLVLRYQYQPTFDTKCEPEAYIGFHLSRNAQPSTYDTVFHKPSSDPAAWNTVWLPYRIQQDNQVAPHTVVLSAFLFTQCSTKPNRRYSMPGWRRCSTCVLPLACWPQTNVFASREVRNQMWPRGIPNQPHLPLPKFVLTVDMENSQIVRVAAHQGVHWIKHLQSTSATRVPRVHPTNYMPVVPKECLQQSVRQWLGSSDHHTQQGQHWLQEMRVLFQTLGKQMSSINDFVGETGVGHEFLLPSMGLADEVFIDSSIGLIPPSVYHKAACQRGVGADGKPERQSAALFDYHLCYASERDQIPLCALYRAATSGIPTVAALELIMASAMPVRVRAYKLDAQCVKVHTNIQMLHDVYNTLSKQLRSEQQQRQIFRWSSISSDPFARQLVQSENETKPNAGNEVIIDQFDSSSDSADPSNEVNDCESLSRDIRDPLHDLQSMDPNDTKLPATVRWAAKVLQQYVVCEMVTEINGVVLAGQITSHQKDEMKAVNWNRNEIQSHEQRNWDSVQKEFGNLECHVHSLCVPLRVWNIWVLRGQRYQQYMDAWSTSGSPELEPPPFELSDDLYDECDYPVGVGEGTEYSRAVQWSVPSWKKFRAGHSKPRLHLQCPAECISCHGKSKPATETDLAEDDQPRVDADGYRELTEEIQRQPWRKYFRYRTSSYSAYEYNFYAYANSIAGGPEINALGYSTAALVDTHNHRIGIDFQTVMRPGGASKHNPRKIAIMPMGRVLQSEDQNAINKMIPYLPPVRPLPNDSSALAMPVNKVQPFSSNHTHTLQAYLYCRPIDWPVAEPLLRQFIKVNEQRWEIQGIRKRYLHAGGDIWEILIVHSKQDVRYFE